MDFGENSTTVKAFLDKHFFTCAEKRTEFVPFFLLNGMVHNQTDIKGETGSSSIDILYIFVKSWTEAY